MYTVGFVVLTSNENPKEPRWVPKLCLGESSHKPNAANSESNLNLIMDFKEMKKKRRAVNHKIGNNN